MEAVLVNLNKARGKSSSASRQISEIPDWLLRIACFTTSGTLAMAIFTFCGFV
jgi:hypothetical protein